MLEQRQMRLDASSIPLEDIYMAMGYRGAQPEVQIRKWISEVYSDIVPICAPRYMYQILEVDKLSGRCLQIGGIDFHVGGIIGSYLPGMTHACLFVTTAGQEYDAYLNSLKKADNIIKEYIADAIGSAVAEFVSILCPKNWIWHVGRCNIVCLIARDIVDGTFVNSRSCFRFSLRILVASLCPTRLLCHRSSR